MTTISLQGLTKSNLTKKDLKNFLSNFKNVKSYDDFGNEEYTVYTAGIQTVAAIDINTGDVWIKNN